MSIEAMKLALEALENPWKAKPEGVANAITDLRQAIEQAQQMPPSAYSNTHQPEQEPVTNCRHCGGANTVICAGQCKQAQKQEPVAWAQLSENGKLIDLLEEPCKGYVPLYTAPPQRQPLTDEELKKTWYDTKNIMGWYSFQEIARAIEAAHGIKGEA